MLAIKTILFPTDFSERSQYAFHLACALARDYGARMLIAHVKAPPAVVYGEFGALPPEPGQEDEALREQLVAIMPSQGDIAVEHFFLVGEPAEEIIRLADEQGADIIVMGTHGRRGLGRLLMGSVAEQVVRKASCPVVTARTPVMETAAAGDAGVVHAAH